MELQQYGLNVLYIKICFIKYIKMFYDTSAADCVLSSSAHGVDVQLTVST